MPRRLGRRIAIGCAIGIVAACAVLILARATALRMALDTALAAQGFSDARYRIASVGLGGTRIVDVQLGDELAVAEVSLRYRPLQLMRMEVEEIAITGLRLDLAAAEAGSPPRPLARLLSGGEEGAEPSSGPPAGLPSIPPLRIADGTLRLPGQITVTISDARWSPADDGRAYALAVAGLDVNRSAQRIALRDVTARVAADFRQQGEAIARFSVAALSHDVTEPVVAPVALAGTIEPDDDVWRLQATATGAHAAQLAIAAHYDWAARTAGGRITLPATQFSPGGLQPGQILPPLAAMTEVRGAVAGHVGALWRSGRAVVDGALRIDNLGFTVGGAPVDALTARLMLSTEGESAQPVLRIEQASVAVAGGTVHVDPVTLRPLAETNRIVLRAAGLDVARLLGAFDLSGISGEGLIDGQLPLVLTADGTVAVEAGKLEAQGPGVLRVASPDAAAALASGGEDANLLLQALADFRYDRLALTVDKPLSGDSRLTLTTFGHNPAVLDGHPFQINVTVTTNLDKILSVIGEGGRLSQAVIRAIVGAR